MESQKDNIFLKKSVWLVGGEGEERMLQRNKESGRRMEGEGKHKNKMKVRVVNS